MIAARTAYLLFAALTVFAVVTLKGKPLILALILVFAMAAKTYVDEQRRHL